MNRFDFQTTARVADAAPEPNILPRSTLFDDVNIDTAFHLPAADLEPGTWTAACLSVELPENTENGNPHEDNLERKTPVTQSNFTCLAKKYDRDKFKTRSASLESAVSPKPVNQPIHCFEANKALAFLHGKTKSVGLIRSQNIECLQYSICKWLSRTIEMCIFCRHSENDVEKSKTFHIQQQTKNGVNRISSMGSSVDM